MLARLSDKTDLEYMTLIIGVCTKRLDKQQLL